jgi:hypothetical protein
MKVEIPEKLKGGSAMDSYFTELDKLTETVKDKREDLRRAEYEFKDAESQLLEKLLKSPDLARNVLTISYSKLSRIIYNNRR